MVAVSSPRSQGEGQPTTLLAHATLKKEAYFDPFFKGAKFWRQKKEGAGPVDNFSLQKHAPYFQVLPDPVGRWAEGNPKVFELRKRPSRVVSKVGDRSIS